MKSRKLAKVIHRAILASKTDGIRHTVGKRGDAAELIGWVYLENYVLDDIAFRKLKGIFSKLGYYLGNASAEAGDEDADYPIIYVASRKLNRNELRALVDGEETPADVLNYFFLEEGDVLDDIAFEEFSDIVSRIGYYLGDVAAETGEDMSDTTILYIAREPLSRAELKKYFGIEDYSDST